MKTTIIIVFTFIAIIIISGCSSNDSSHIEINSKEDFNEFPLNPEILTKHDKIGQHQIMDEYYLSKKGRKVWHGYRKNLHSNGFPRMTSYYQHGKLQWTETYDELGNVIKSDR